MHIVYQLPKRLYGIQRENGGFGMSISRSTSQNVLAIVTGGTRGLGAEITSAFVSAGYSVAAIYAGRDDEALSLSKRVGCEIYNCNVASPEACVETVLQIKEKLGKCSVLVNNAGINIDGRIEKLKHEDWKKVIDTNLGGCFNMTQAVLPDMREGGWGRLIHIGSVVASIGGFGISNYIASKSAIEGFSRAVALEEAQFNITSNVIAPGFLDVGMIRAVPEAHITAIRNKIPLGRLGRAEEIAHATLFLADELSSFITGASIPINGGLSPA